MKPKNEPGIPAWRGDALRLRRIAAGWTTAQLAERIGVSKTTLIRWERNENAPNSQAVQALAVALDVEVAAFSKAPRVV
jgi:transcriptional regulator with XRE-family HTH domain